MVSCIRGESMKKSEVIKALEHNELFDFVSKEYYRMSKPELVGLCKELAYYFGVGAERYNFSWLDELGDTIENDGLTYNFED